MGRVRTFRYAHDQLQDRFTWTGCKDVNGHGLFSEMDETLRGFFASAALPDVIPEDVFAAQFGLDLPSSDASKALYTALAKQRQATLAQIEANVSEGKYFPKKEAVARRPNLLKADALALLASMEKGVAFNSSLLQEIDDAIEAELQLLSAAADEIEEKSKFLMSINDEKLEKSIMKCEALLK